MIDEERVGNPYRLAQGSWSAPDGAPTAVDLFSGAGGLTLGLLSAGFHVLGCVDNALACATTHCRNFPLIPFELADIGKMAGPDLRHRLGIGRGELDLMAGGPPCQGFSILGQRQIWDPRNGLFQEFIRLADELRPRAVLMENVTGLATLEGGAVLAAISRAFDEAGYTADCAELLAAQYGVPQMRWRMIFVGWRKDLARRGGFPLPTHGRAGIGDLVPNRKVSPEDSAGFVTIRDAIGDLPPVAAGGVNEVYSGKPRGLFQEAMRNGSERELFNHYAPRLSSQNLARIHLLKPGQDWRALPFDMLPPGMQRALRKDHTRRYRRMTWDGIARAIITRFRDPKSGEYIHPEQDRTISIREAARIQSFPDWFKFEGGYTEQYEQVGNAVPPLLGKAVGLALRSKLENGADALEAVKSRYTMPAAPPAAVAAAGR